MSNSEHFIQKLYESINVGEPDHLSIMAITFKLCIGLHYWPYSSELVEYEGKYKVFINEHLGSQQQWQDFGHEMKHYFFDNGSQKNLTNLFIDYQETKADYFAYHFCVPSFMLKKLRTITVYEVMNLFNVEFDFALQRIEMFKNNHITERVAENARTY